jgi:ornithine carbamoyltransferase
LKPPKIRSKDLLTLTDLSKKEILALFAFAAKLKKDRAAGKSHRLLEGKTLAMIFEKNSTRTRVSFEAGMYQLGGHALFLSSDNIQIGRGETAADTSRVLSRYVDGIMVRTYSQETIKELAANSNIPVINGLSDQFHPCQALADYFTIYEREKDLSGRKLAYVGDGNNVAHSLLLGASILGTSIAVASPAGFMPDSGVVATAKSIARTTGAVITITSNIDSAVEGSNYLYTDVWTSMGKEKEAAVRRKAFRGYRITRKMLNMCAPGCAVMHCLPAHRGEEIDADVIDSDRSIVFDQAENRLHIQKSLLCALMIR